MFVFVVLLFILSIYKCKPRLDKGFYDDYASINQSRSINGIFIMLILLSHTFARVTPSGVFDEIYLPFRIFLGQFVVVPFLFYSGYGIMESIKNKGSYIRTFPKKRLLKIFIRFLIITVIYIFLHLCLQSEYSLTHILLSFTGIKSIGNGGWYMFSTFIFYICVIICFNVFKKNNWLAVISVAFCLVALAVVEILFRFPTYYYNTTIFFVVGMFYSLLKDKFDAIVMKNNIVWLATMLLSIIGFVFLKGFVTLSVIFYPVWCMAGMLMILCLTMKLKIQNKALIWFGKTIFYNFMLQAIAQIVFTKFLKNNIVIYILVIVVTIIFTYLADYLFTRADKSYLQRKKQ